MNLNIREILSDFKHKSLQSKKFWLIYILLIIVGSISLINIENFAHPKMEIFILLLLSIVGICIITYYSHHDSDKELYKTAFVILLIFGLICTFIMPICEPSDSVEHLSRAEITSRGIIFPEYTGSNYTNQVYNGTDYVWNGDGFYVISSIKNISYDRFETVFTGQHSDEKIDHTLIIVDQVFEQNPFYGYLPQAIGILLAKLLDLNSIWLLWLGTICNLIFYSGVVAYSVKKTPIFKIPLLVTACLPVALFQVVSVSIDAMIFSLSFLIIAYFFKMCKSEDNTVDIKDISIFLVLCLLVGLCKLPFLGFVFLIFGIPFNKFKNKNVLIYSIAGIAVISLISLFWSNYATESLWHSHRAAHYLKDNVNSTQQLSFLLETPSNVIIFIKNSFNAIESVLLNNFLMYPNYNGGYATASEFINTVIALFMGVVYLAYPIKEKINLKSKISVLIVLAIIYFGTAFVQLLTWGSVGDLSAVGISPRYFLPLFVLIPFVFSFNTGNNGNNDFDKYVIVLSISFMALMILSLVYKFY